VLEIRRGGTPGFSGERGNTTTGVTCWGGKPKRRGKKTQKRLGEIKILVHESTKRTKGTTRKVWKKGKGREVA